VPEWNSLPDSVSSLKYGIQCRNGINLSKFAHLYFFSFPGTSSIVLQIVFADIAALLIGLLELSYIYQSKWLFSPDLCAIYLGVDSFTSTSTIYFIVMINLHSISTFNLARKTSIENQSCRQKAADEDLYEESSCTKSFIDEPEQGDGNYEVARPERVIKSRYKRSITIDYRPRKTKISVILPTIYIWVMSASVALPFFILSDVIPSVADPQVCGIRNFDGHNVLLLQVFAMAIRVVVPCVCLLLAMVWTVQKLCSTSELTLTELGEVDERVDGNLKISLVFSVIFVVCSLQKLIISLVFEILTRPFMMPKYPNVNSKLVPVALALLNSTASVVRPIVYLTMENSIRIKYPDKNKAKYER
jgi:hypothetical protein